MPILLVGLAGLGGGFILGKGTDGIGNMVKWGVLGGGGYLAAKHFGVLK